MTSHPILLGVDEDKARQAALAAVFNSEGIFYRFVADRRKVRGGVEQLSPDMVVVFGELSSDFVIQVLDSLAGDVAAAQLPVVVVGGELSDAPFVQAMRSGVVALLPPPVDAGKVASIRGVWNELQHRSGTLSGQSGAAGLRALADHLRRTRRSGLLVVGVKGQGEGRATFVKGKLERASHQSLVGPEAFRAMLAQPGTLPYSFSEMAGHPGDGQGVVIEVGEGDVAEDEVLVVVGETVDEPHPHEMRPEPSAPRRQSPGAPRPRLLLVDDDDALLRMFSTLFTKHGFDVETAADGEQGMAAALARPFEVVLADLNMPHLDGWGLLRLIREDFRTRELPVAFISAHDDYRESLKALNAGAQAYISKGTRLDALVGQVKKLLEPRQLAEEALQKGEPMDVVVHAVGPQWLVARLAALGQSGLLAAQDGWASYQLGFSLGNLLHASARAGRFSAEGERAFNAFVASTAAQATWTPGGLPGLPRNLQRPVSALLEGACGTLNENDRQLREKLLVEATEIDVNDDLYAVYKQVGPRQWLEMARLICEEKLTPRQVLGTLDASPLELEDTMKDLVRRGVVTLKAA